MEYDSLTVTWTLLAILWFVIMMAGVVVLIATWKMYEKAEKPGWASIIPVYNTIVLFEIVGLPTWLVILYLVPVVNFLAIPIIVVVTALKLAKCFGKDTAFAIGLILLPIIFYPILGFGKDTYQGPQEGI